MSPPTPARDQADAVLVVAHPAERRHRRSSLPAQAGPECACCCCCLRTLGSILGATVAPDIGGPGPRLPLTHYWKQLAPGSWPPSASDPQAVTRGQDAVTAEGPSTGSLP